MIAEVTHTMATPFLSGPPFCNATIVDDNAKSPSVTFTVSNDCCLPPALQPVHRPTAFHKFCTALSARKQRRQQQPQHHDENMQCQFPWQAQQQELEQQQFQSQCQQGLPQTQQILPQHEQLQVNQQHFEQNSTLTNRRNQTITQLDERLVTGNVTCINKNRSRRRFLKAIVPARKRDDRTGSKNSKRISCPLMMIEEKPEETDVSRRRQSECDICPRPPKRKSSLIADELEIGLKLDSEEFM